MYIRMFRNHIQVERSDNNRRIIPPTHMNILVQRISLVHNHIYPLMNRRKKEGTSRLTSIHRFIIPLYKNDKFILFNTIGHEIDVSKV